MVDVAHLEMHSHAHPPGPINDGSLAYRPLPKYQGTEVVDKDRFGGHEQVLKQLGPTINLCAFSLLLSAPGLRT